MAYAPLREDPARTNEFGNWTKPVVDREAKTVSFTVQDHAGGVEGDGTVNRNGATCVACGSTVPLAHIREHGRAGKISEQMTGIATLRLSRCPEI